MTTTNQQSRLHKFVVDMFGGGGSYIVESIGRMSTAGNIVDDAMIKYPGDAAKIRKCFLLACPGEQMHGAPDQVYQRHVDEIVYRSRYNIDTRDPTASEILMAAMRASLKAPLNELGRGLYVRVGRMVIPGIVDDDVQVSEPWPGAIDEQLVLLSRAGRSPGRKHPGQTSPKPAWPTGWRC